MGYGQYLVRRKGGTYIVRLSVPTSIQSRIGRREIRISTKCQERAQALLVASAVLLNWRRAFQEFEKLDALKVAEGAPVFAGSGTIKLSEAAAALGTTPSALVLALASHKRSPNLLVHADRWRAWKVAPDTTIDQDELGAYILNDVEEQGDPCSVSGLIELEHSDHHAFELANAGETILVKASWPGWAGKVYFCPLNPPVRLEAILLRKQDVEAYRLTILAATPPEQISHQRALQLARATAAPPEIKHKPHHDTRITELIRKYIDKHSTHHGGKNLRPWKPDQALRVNQKLRCFPEFMGDMTMGELDALSHNQQHELIDKYWLKLKTLPTGPALSKARREAKNDTAPEVAAWAAAQGMTTMTEQTLLSYTAELKAFFAWCITSERCLEHNPASEYQGDGRDRSSKENEKRDLFDASELRLIFSADYYKTGRAPINGRGKTLATYRPFYYWIPLLSLYTGARPNELAQLYLDDIRVLESQQAFIDMTMVGDASRPDQMEADEDDPSGSKRTGSQSLKTVNARRVIPLHKKLIDLGLLEYITALRSSGQTRLFPELRHDVNKGYGLEARKWFNERRLGNELQIERNGRKTLYSFRHGFSTALERQENPPVPEHAIAQLMGHTRGEELAKRRYTKDRTVSELAPYIERLSFDLPEIASFDVTDGIRAMEYAVRLKDSYVRKKD